MHSSIPTQGQYSTLLQLLLLLLVAATISNCQQKQRQQVWPGPSQWSAGRYVQYVPGNSCVVISVPHDGHLRPRSMANRRRYGCYMSARRGCVWGRRCPRSYARWRTLSCKAVVVRDSFTSQVAWRTARQLAALGIRPHLVVNRLHRSKMDPNRSSLMQATQGDRRATMVYRSYHSFLRSAVAAVKRRNSGKGLLVDIHAQRHSQNWTEIGYRLSKKYVNKRQYPVSKLSIRGLSQRSSQSVQQLITGNSSFGSLLSDHGHRVVPSARIPSPGNGGYYRGGYITYRYGSLQGGSFDAVQVEITTAVLRAGSRHRNQFADDLGRTIQKFLLEHSYCD